MFVIGRRRSSAAMGHFWFTDCESLFAHLVSPNTKQVDNKRLAIDLSALTQLIWDNRDDCDEEVDGSKGVYRRWILRLLYEDDDILPVERNVEHKYL